MDELELKGPLQESAKTEINNELGRKLKSQKAEGFTQNTNPKAMAAIEAGIVSPEQLAEAVKTQPMAVAALKTTIIDQHKTKELNKKDFKTLERARNVAYETGLIDKKLYDRLEALAYNAKRIKKNGEVVPTKAPQNNEQTVDETLDTATEETIPDPIAPEDIATEAENTTLSEISSDISYLNSAVQNPDKTFSTDEEISKFQDTLSLAHEKTPEMTQAEYDTLQNVRDSLVQLGVLSEEEASILKDSVDTNSKIVDTSTPITPTDTVSTDDQSSTTTQQEVDTTSPVNAQEDTSIETDTSVDAVQTPESSPVSSPISALKDTILSKESTEIGVDDATSAKETILNTVSSQEEITQDDLDTITGVMQKLDESQQITLEEVNAIEEAGRDLKIVQEYTPTANNQQNNVQSEQITNAPQDQNTQTNTPVTQKSNDNTAPVTNTGTTNANSNNDVNPKSVLKENKLDTPVTNAINDLQYSKPDSITKDNKQRLFSNLTRIMNLVSNLPALTYEDKLQLTDLVDLSVSNRIIQDEKIAQRYKEIIDKIPDVEQSESVTDSKADNKTSENSDKGTTNTTKENATKDNTNASTKDTATSEKKSTDDSVDTSTKTSTVKQENIADEERTAEGHNVEDGTVVTEDQFDYMDEEMVESREAENAEGVTVKEMSSEKKSMLREFMGKYDNMC